MPAPERWISHDAEETISLGARFAQRLQGGDVVALRGELGSGKTHLAKGICSGLGYQGVVSSPTFALINEYGGTPSLYHIDLYRIDSPLGVRALGIEEMFNSNSIAIVEWPDIAAAILPATTWNIDCEYGSTTNERLFIVSRPS